MAGKKIWVELNFHDQGNIIQNIYFGLEARNEKLITETRANITGIPPELLSDDIKIVEEFIALRRQQNPHLS